MIGMLGSPNDSERSRIAGKRVWVAGHRGMVGSALIRRLARENCHLTLADRHQVDLTRQSAVDHWMQANRPDIVFVAAARVGGILANATSPASFLYNNLMIAANIISAAHRCRVECLLFLGSSCIYPKHAAQPMREDMLLTGELERTNEAYAIAKIAGAKLVEAYSRQHGCRFFCAMPPNLYGPNDNFNLETSHVLPALLRKIHEAKCSGHRKVVIWGSGTPRREFMHVDDLADACIFLLEKHTSNEMVNVGSGHDLTIRELAQTIAEVVGYEGGFVFDTTKPDGTMRKLMDSSKLERLGWRPRIELREGIKATYEHWLESGAGPLAGITRAG